MKLDDRITIIIKTYVFMKGKRYIFRHTECKETWDTRKNLQHYST